MKLEIRYAILVSLFISLFAYSSASENKDKHKASIETVETPLVTPTVEDSVLQQLGGKLYFTDGGNISPSERITVIGTNHHYSKSYGQYLEYKFIVHGKNTTYHKPFTSESLDKVYKSYFSGEDEIYKDYPTYYNERLEKQKKLASETNIDSSINNYIGYWIYLKKHDNQFYIDDIWAWTASFHLSETTMTDHYMDGPYPTIITYFKEDTNGDLLFKLVESDDTIRYKLVDKELRIYLTNDGYYTVPAQNANEFEIIEYANNTGDLI